MSHTQYQHSVFWYTSQLGDEHYHKISLLEERGFVVKVFGTMENLVSGIKQKRAMYYIVGDEASQEELICVIKTLATMAEIQGARFVFSYSNASENILDRVAAEGYRDILPIYLPHEEWVQRFIYSTETVLIKLEAPSLQIVCQSQISVDVPARIAWVSDDKICIESRVRPEVGRQLMLKGALSSAMGASHLQLTVESLHMQNLNFRFSVGALAGWRITGGDSRKISEVKQALSNFARDERQRIFVAIQSPALRNTLLKHFNAGTYEVRAALQKRSLVDEPKFFSPHLLFIEERMCVGDNLSRFGIIVGNLPKLSAVIIIGSDNHRSSLTGLMNGRPLFFLKNIPVNLIEQVEKQFLSKATFSQSVKDPSAWVIPREHEYSFALLHVPACLERIHPTMARLALPFHVENYALVKLEAPVFKKVIGYGPYAKITTTSEEALHSRDYPYGINAYFCDLDPAQRRKIGLALSRATNEAMRQGEIDTKDIMEYFHQQENALRMPENVAQGARTAERDFSNIEVRSASIRRLLQPLMFILSLVITSLSLVGALYYFATSVVKEEAEQPVSTFTEDIKDSRREIRIEATKDNESNERKASSLNAH